MKNKRLERMREAQRVYHRRCSWVMRDGIYAPHSYADTPPDARSWWDDVGFILGDRRVMVWWIHPRQAYADQIEEQAGREAGEPPAFSHYLDASTPNYKRVGRSRKKIVSYTRQPFQGEKRQYYDQLNALSARLRQTGIDHQVRPSWQRERLAWGTGVTLVAPLEVRNEQELKAVAELARRLLQGETTLEREFPGYGYGRKEWLAEQSFIYSPANRSTVSG